MEIATGLITGGFRKELADRLMTGALQLEPADGAYDRSLGDGASQLHASAGSPHMSPLENRYSFHSISHVARSVSAVKASGLRFQPFHYILTEIPLSDRYSLSSRISSSL